MGSTPCRPSVARGLRDDVHAADMCPVRERHLRAVAIPPPPTLPLPYPILRDLASTNPGSTMPPQLPCPLAQRALAVAVPTRHQRLCPSHAVGYAAGSVSWRVMLVVRYPWGCSQRCGATVLCMSYPHSEGCIPLWYTTTQTKNRKEEVVWPQNSPCMT